MYVDSPRGSRGLGLYGEGDPDQDFINAQLESGVSHGIDLTASWPSWTARHGATYLVYWKVSPPQQFSPGIEDARWRALALALFDQAPGVVRGRGAATNSISPTMAYTMVVARRAEPLGNLLPRTLNAGGVTYTLMRIFDYGGQTQDVEYPAGEYEWIKGWAAAPAQTHRVELPDGRVAIVSGPAPAGSSSSGQAATQPVDYLPPAGAGGAGELVTVGEALADAPSPGGANRGLLIGAAALALLFLFRR